MMKKSSVKKTMSIKPCIGAISELPSIANLKKLTMYRIGFSFEINWHSVDKISIEYTHRKVPGFPLEQLFIMDPDGVKVELNYATS